MTLKFIHCLLILFFWLLTPVQVSSATATFAMTFSSSMSVVEYYLLKRFPVPYGKLGTHDNVINLLKFVLIIWK